MRTFLPKYANLGLTSEGHSLNLLAQSEWSKTDWTRQSKSLEVYEDRKSYVLIDIIGSKENINNSFFRGGGGVS